MKKLLSLILSLAIAFPLPLVRAQEGAPAPVYSQAELDQMLAPIALYPDALLSQVLMAATYPLEVVEAARWSRAHAGLKGDEAVRTAADQDWDPSVKSLLAFPELLRRMDEKLDWTKRLGEAFLAQEAHVMDTIQDLRRRARAAGYAGDDRVRVVDEGGAVVIEPADPGVVYVPYYDPLVVYGTWWWPAYPPVVWAAWPGYVVVRPGIWWGVGIVVTAGFFFGAVSWPHRHVTVVRRDVYYARPPVFRRSVVVHRPLVVGTWRHDPTRRHGAELRRRQAPANAPDRRELRRDDRRELRRDRRQAPRRIERRDDRRGHLMPPAWRSSAPTAPREAGSQSPRRLERALPYDRGHGRSGRTVDRSDDRRGARADAAQHGAAQPHGFAGNARRHAGAVPVRPAFRAGMADDRPRRGR